MQPHWKGIETVTRYFQIRKDVSRDIYIHRSLFPRFSSQVRDHTYISHGAHAMCVHWRQETSLVDDFCHDKTSNIFVETTDPYTHIYRSKKYLYMLLQILRIAQILASYGDI